METKEVVTMSRTEIRLLMREMIHNEFQNRMVSLVEIIDFLERNFPKHFQDLTPDAKYGTTFKHDIHWCLHESSPATRDDIIRAAMLCMEEVTGTPLTKEDKKNIKNKAKTRLDEKGPHKKPTLIPAERYDKSKKRSYFVW